MGKEEINKTIKQTNQRLDFDVLPDSSKIWLSLYQVTQLSTRRQSVYHIR